MSVRVSIDSKNLDATRGATLFECAEAMEIRVPTSCHKNGKCRECLVEIDEGAELLSPRSAEEEHLEGDFRLSCRATLTADDGCVRGHTLRRGSIRISEGGVASASVERRFDPAVTRDGERVLLDGVELCRRPGPLHGLAVDVGTTTVVVRLVDLESGSVLALRSFENPQRFGGSDVMARIRYDTDHKGKLLQRTLLGYLSHAIEDFECEAETIYEIVVAGNATMRDLLFGLDVYSIGQMPYQSITEKEVEAGERASTSLSTTAKKLRLPAFPDARVWALPLVRGHVGADTAACLLAIGFPEEAGTVALMDVGTNTELVVGNATQALTASCPAGPAFEGGSIACGMPGLEGAIESVALDADGVKETGVIGGGAPAGICGSGLIELLGELRRTDRMNELGRFVDDSDRFVVDESKNVYLTEADISELAQAKGANVAGLYLVFERHGIDFADLDRFYFAGGFAEHLDLDAARRIGLIPDLPDDRLAQIGNASIEGATVALLSRSAREDLERTLANIEHVELEAESRFFDCFVEGCQFRPVTTTKEVPR